MSNVIDMSAVTDRKDKAVVSASETTALINVIERAARDPNIDIDKMERLLAMQERIFARTAEAEFNAAMSACQAEMPIIKATFQNEQTGSLYAALEEIDRIAKPIYTRHGFGLSFGTTDCPIEGLYRQTCKVSHRAGHSEMRFADLPLDTMGPKGTPNKTAIQGFSSSMTYGQRIITRLVFNIVIGDDTDGNGPTLSKDQIATIEAKMREAGTNKEQFLEFWRIKSLAVMPAFNFEVIMDMLARKAARIDPRGDLSGVDTTLRDKRCSEIVDLINEYGSDEDKLAEVLQDYHKTYLNPFPELWIAINDKLAADKVISKANMRKFLSLALKS